MADIWSPPAPRTNDYPAQPQGFDVLFARLDAIERQLSEVRSSLLANTGIAVSPAGMVIDSALTVDGTLDVAGAMRVLGTLSLPAGIIDNDALASPITPGLGSTAETNFTVPPGGTLRAAGTIPIPAGFTRALVDCAAYAGVVNTLAANYLYVSAVINGTPGHEGIGGNNPTSIAWVAASSRKVSLLTGLSPGGTISIGALLSTTDTATWGANTSNRAYCDALVVFLR